MPPSHLSPGRKHLGEDQLFHELRHESKLWKENTKCKIICIIVGYDGTFIDTLKVGEISNIALALKMFGIEKKAFGLTALLWAALQAS